MLSHPKPEVPQIVASSSILSVLSLERENLWIEETALILISSTKHPQHPQIDKIVINQFLIVSSCGEALSSDRLKNDTRCIHRISSDDLLKNICGYDPGPVKNSNDYFPTGPAIRFLVKANPHRAFLPLMEILVLGLYSFFCAFSFRSRRPFLALAHPKNPIFRQMADFPHRPAGGVNPVRF
jgi:hypothetical protein